MKNAELIKKIGSHIEKSGFHITLVTSSIIPRWSYTVGLYEKYNFELIFAGGIYYMADQVYDIIHKIVAEIVRRDGTYFDKIDLGELGTFSINYVDKSWSKWMMLRVFNYYNITDINAFQIIPDSDHLTLDVPDMSRLFDVTLEPVWQWQDKKWDLNVAEDSTVTTNIEVLMGTPVTELARWEDNYWEMFSEVGPDVPDGRKRVVSIGTMIAIDPTIIPALDLPLEKGLLRDSKDDDWVDW